MKTSFPRILSFAAGVAALFLAVATPARAAIIVGSFDPVFGGGFTNMSWSGYIKLSVPDPCLTGDAGITVRPSGLTLCLGAKTLEAKVHLTETLGGDSQTIAFGDRPWLGLLQIDTDAELLTGFSTIGCFACGPLSTFKSPDREASLNFPLGYDLFSYGLSFTLGSPSVQLYADIAARDVNPDVKKMLFQNEGEGPLYDNCRAINSWRGTPLYYECVSGNTEATSARFSLAQYPDNYVPEPGTATLVLGALVAGGWLQRRKQQLARRQA